ncbi:MAG: hypothetical protein ACRCST_00695 [Turicibacter sp.]
MINEATLAFIIKAFCSLKSPSDFDHPIKGRCVDYMINCSIEYNKGESSELKVGQCKEAWADIELKFKKELNK